MEGSNTLKLVLMPQLKIHESVMPLLFSLIRMAFLPWLAAGLEFSFTEQAVFGDHRGIKHHRTGSNSTQILEIMSNESQGAGKVCRVCLVDR